MSVLRFISIDALLLLFMHLDPLTLIIVFSCKTSSVLPFQYPQKKGAGIHGGRRKHSDLHSMGWASTVSPSAHRIPRKTFLGLSSQFLNQEPSPGPLTRTRDMASLSEWSRGSGIVLTDGVELSEDLLGDWSLTTTKSIEQGSSIMTIPAQVILTSDVSGDSSSPYYSEDDMQNIRDWIESELESGSQAKQDYLPEYMLVYKLLREVHMGANSRWYPWLQSLPTHFSTGLYLDEVERKHVERMTGEYIHVQSLQYGACLELFQQLVSSQKSKGKNSLVPNEFLEWLLALQQDSSNGETNFEGLVKWAYSVVFTRSWRSPDRTQAQIVPLGDLANHDSQFANLKPGFREKDGAFQFFVTSDIDVAGSISPKLYLSYGLTFSPARFLVIFGFCDVTAAYIDANIDFVPDNEAEWPSTLDPFQLVVSTLNGALSEEVWIAFLYKVLQKNEPDVLTRIRNAFVDSEKKGNKLVEELLEKWEFDVGMEIQAYYQRLLETDFMPITVAEQDLARHPNLSMIINYNLYIRETYLNVLEHVQTFLTQCTQFKELTAPRNENGLGETVSESQESSILHFQSNSSRQTNHTSMNEKGSPARAISNKKSNQSVSRQSPLSESSSKTASDTNFSSSVLESTNTSAQMSKEDTAKDFSKRNSSQSELNEESTSFKKSADVVRGNNLPYQMPQNTNASEQMIGENLSPDPVSSISSEYSDQRFYPVQEPQEMINWSNTTEIDRSETPPATQIDMSQKGSELNATSRFSSDNFSLQSYSYGNPASNDGVLDDNYGEFSQEISTGNFNPEYYTASRQGTTQHSFHSSTAPTAPYEDVESQSYSNPELYSYDQQSQFDFNIQTTPTSGGIGPATTPAFPYASSNPQSYSEEQIDSVATPPFDYGNSNSIPYSDYNEATIFPDADIDFQPDADMGFRPDTDTDFQPYSDYRNSNSNSYYNSENIQADERADPTLTPAFPKSANLGFQPDSDGETIPSQKGIDANDGKDLTASYAQSLVSDQRGIGSESSEHTNVDDASKPTTYAEYMKQRQQEEEQSAPGGGI